MATRDTDHTASGITRRDFLKTSAVAGAAVGCGLSVAYDPEKAAAYEYDTTNYKVTNTTCPYCSASCGQRVVKALTGTNAGKVVDIYGDFESPMNSGGLCAKGAGALQLVNNPRRIGAFAGTHPQTNRPNVPVTAGYDSNVFAYDSTYTDGIAYKRTGDGPWIKQSLNTALGDIATAMVTARAFDATGWNPGAGSYNSKSVAFMGCSHMNNESNYLYRKLIANFGTSNVEHQARI